MLVMLPWKLVKEGATGALAAKLVLNASFLFGFHDPAANAMLIGGWSLGIEAIYYLLFPLLAWAAIRGGPGLALFACLLALQGAWIALTDGAEGGYAKNAVDYHQAPDLAAYFMGGCLLGQWRRMGIGLRVSPTGLAALVAGGFALLGVLNPVAAGDELLGWRGAACGALSFAMVWMAGGVKLRERHAAVAAHLGDATYGLYLMHPVIFFGLAWVVLPRLGVGAPASWGLATQAVFTLAVLLAAFTLALLSERYFEHPLRERSKKRLA
jgi:peptidoglycan/LPS O-acetylase OafA/YrhL